MIDIHPNALATDGKYGGKTLILELQRKARTVLDPLLPEGSRPVLLDFPNNSNVGDSLIWLGEVAYLKQRHMAPAYTSDMHDFSYAGLRAVLDPNTVILMHGGGNFGTLWPDEQRFRLRVLREFPGVPVVQLPQSIFFEDSTLLEETRQAIEAHGNYTLVVRDQASYEFAMAHFACRVALCPDMAFFIGSLAAKNDPPYDRFVLARTDCESAQSWFVDAPELREGRTQYNSDWLEQGMVEKVLNRVHRHSARMRQSLDPCNMWLFGLYNRLASTRQARGMDLLNTGRVVIADRLHVHILSILMEKPHVLFDNRYRKLGNFHDAWTKPYRGVAFVETLREAYLAAAQYDEDVER
ncbi:MAG TPA: polysaccharide pyruvyl transferase family protein, partial [Burkholderiaceae bacterium]